MLAYLGPHPSPALIILILLHTGELAYCWHHEIFSDHQYFLFRVLENGLLVLIELFLLLLLNFSSFAGSDSYIYIGYLLSGFALLVAVNGLARVGYLGRRKYLEAVGEQFEQV